MSEVLLYLYLYTNGKATLVDYACYVTRVTHNTHKSSAFTNHQTKAGLLRINLEDVTCLCNYTHNMEHAIRGMWLVREPLIEVEVFNRQMYFWALRRCIKSWVKAAGQAHCKVLITRAVACKLGCDCLAVRFPSNLKNSRYRSLVTLSDPAVNIKAAY